MVTTRKQRIAGQSVKLKQPDRSGPSEQTLLDIATQRSLFDRAAERERQLGHANDSPLSPRTERLLEAALWTSTLAMVHFTFDVFVHNQYASSIDWPAICTNTLRAWAAFFVVFYPLHPHAANTTLVPGLRPSRQHIARQTLFFACSCAAGCALIYVTNAKGYLYNMKRAPPLACLWLWAVVELDLAWAVLSLAVAGGFLWANGYSIK